MLDISKLQVGQKYKSYKALCAALDEPVKSSSSKEAQLKKWKQYFKFEQNKWEITITEVYDEPQIVIPYQESKTTQYAEALYPIIIDLLYKESLKDKDSHKNDSQKNFPKITMTKQEWFCALGFAQKIYYTPKYTTNYQYKIYNEARNEYYSMINQAFEKAIEKLEEAKRIVFSKRYNIQPFKGSERVTDDIETALIKSNIDYTIRKIGYKSFYDIIRKEQIESFNAYLNDLLAQYYFYYRSRVIQLSIPNISDDVWSDDHKLERIQNYIKKNNIQMKYTKAFGNNTPEQVNNRIQELRQFINQSILSQIEERNLKTINDIKEKLDNGNTIPYFDNMQKEHEKRKDESKNSLTYKECFEIYQSTRQEFIDSSIKIQ